MKKYFAIVISILMVMSFALTACGGGSGSGTDLSDSKYVGEWRLDSMSLGDESGELDDNEWIITLNADGTGTSVSDAEDGTRETSEFTWELTDDGFKTKGDTKLTFTDDGDGIKTKFLGAELHFVKANGESVSTEEKAAEEEKPTEEETVSAGDANYGYAGSDPIEAAVYKYLGEQVASTFDLTDDTISIPVVQIVDVDVDNDDGEAEVLGDFWVNNYVVEGDTLKCVSGGNFPGKMDLNKVGDAYIVEEFETVADGAGFDSSARDIFEEHYDAFMNVYSDDKTREQVRADIIANYVKASGLAVTKYQDEGWNPVELPASDPDI